MPSQSWIWYQAHRPKYTIHRQCNILRNI